MGAHGQKTGCGYWPVIIVTLISLRRALLAMTSPPHTPCQPVGSTSELQTLPHVDAASNFISVQRLLELCAPNVDQSD
jgi:hypothetical protein